MKFTASNYSAYTVVKLKRSNKECLFSIDTIEFVHLSELKIQEEVFAEIPSSFDWNVGKCIFYNENNTLK